MIHYYDTLGENWFSYAQFYHDIIEKLPKRAKVAEIGCWKGRSTACLGVEIINSGKKIDLYAIDSWKYFEGTEQPVSSQEKFDLIYKEFKNNMQPLGSIVKIIRSTSIKASMSIPNNFFDFIFIDANHTYDSVKEDIYLWEPKLKPGGIIAGHDYFTSVHPGVKRAVDEVYPDAMKISEQNVWYIKK